MTNKKLRQRERKQNNKKNRKKEGQVHVGATESYIAVSRKNY